MLPYKLPPEGQTTNIGDLNVVIQASDFEENEERRRRDSNPR